MKSYTGWMAGVRRHALALTLGALAGVAGEAGAAVLGTETFGGGQSGWVDRDVDEMTVAYNAGFGNAAGSLQGSFDPQGASSPETDAFRITGASSGGMFTGDYWTDVPGFTAWTFSFYADDILPSDLLIRFNDGVNTFVRTVLSQVAAQDNWYSVTVPLTYSGWLGGSASAFSNALSNVTFIDVQLTRNGTGAQSYFLDNFTLSDTSVTAVPEPSTAGLLLASVAVLRAARKKGSRARQVLSGLWSSPGDVGPVPQDQLTQAEPVVSSGARRFGRRKPTKKKIQLIF
jgi:hypothetical protein